MAKKKRKFDIEAFLDEEEGELQAGDAGEFEPEEKSRSQLKREQLARRDLGEQLVELSEARLAKLSLSEQTLDAVRDGQRFTRRALQRQLSRIAALITEFDDEQAIRQGLENLYQPHRDEVHRHHEAEQWRDGLIAGDNAVMEAVTARFPAVDRQHLRQLARNANKEQERQKPPKSARLLYTYLHQLIEEDT
jgi:ribosome-associated protein